MRIGLGTVSLAAILALVGLTGLGSADAQDALCQDPAKFCGDMLSADCLSRVGAGSLAAGTVDPDVVAGECGRQLGDYRDCVASAAAECGAGAVPSPGACGPEDARQLWPDLRESGSVEDLEDFAELCRGTPQAQLAANRARRLREEADRRRQEDPATLYDRFVAAVVPSGAGPDPLSDSRVREALRLHLAPGGGGRDGAVRLLYEAGYPEGFALTVSRELFDGSDTALSDLRSRLAAIGVRLSVS